MEPAEQPNPLEPSVVTAQVGVVFRHLLYSVWSSHVEGPGHGLAADGGRIYDQVARTRSMSGRMRSRAMSRGTPDISRES